VRARPEGTVLLCDKPAGITSHDMVVRLRRERGCKAGHAGTLDPFATGLLVVLSGRATKLAPRFVGLDKRYLTEVDLAATTSTGDREGDVLERHEPPERDELEERLAELRGEVELPVPAASAVKVGGRRAYKLHRQGVAVEMPVRRSRVETLELRGYEDGVARLDLLVSSGTYVRAIATALGGHCVSLRRTEVGPFRVEEADPERLVPAEEALARL
jgi:tRNA pseudouridine55 synthase